MSRSYILILILFLAGIFPKNILCQGYSTPYPTPPPPQQPIEITILETCSLLTSVTVLVLVAVSPRSIKMRRMLGIAPRQKEKNPIIIEYEELNEEARKLNHQKARQSKKLQRMAD